MSEPRNAGEKYERKIKETIQNALIYTDSPLALAENAASGGSNAHDNDLCLTLPGTRIDVEIKGRRAQMGGSSLHFDPETSIFTPIKSMPADLADIVTKKISDLSEPIDHLLHFLRTHDPNGYARGGIRKVPFNVTKTCWNEAVERGMLKPINKKISFDHRAIEHHYNTKKDPVYYIQIEDMGLFYMGDNPFGLPIPRLEGKVDIEVRMRISGTEERKWLGGEKVGGVGLTANGRLKFRAKSPLSLDVPEEASEIIRLLSRSTVSGSGR